MTTQRPNKWCCRAVELAAWTLPAAQRQRYALEYIAELYGMPPRQQVHHAIQVLASAWRLRDALIQTSSTLPQEDIVTTKTPTRPLLCRVGLHQWHIVSTPDGQRYECCLRCEKDRTEQYGTPMAGGSTSGGSGIPAF
ncbi:MAG: hypothetical protein WAS07_00550 [Micropruina sp.]|nr:hypothetical protein [Micropruina sp.]